MLLLKSLKQIFTNQLARLDVSMLLDTGHICSLKFSSWNNDSVARAFRKCILCTVYLHLGYLKNSEVLKSTESSWFICRNIKQFGIGTENYVVQMINCKNRTSSSETAVCPTCSTAFPSSYFNTHRATVSHLLFHLWWAAVLHLISHLSCLIYMKPLGTWNVSHQCPTKRWVLHSVQLWYTNRKST